jgi:Coenzyme PQQ synthesis protein D (PqqD)
MKYDDTIFKLSDHQVSTHLGDEAVVLNHQKGLYFSLNEVGTHIWAFLAGRAATYNDIVAEVQRVFEIDLPECQQDVKDLLKALHDENLVEIA